MTGNQSTWNNIKNWKEWKIITYFNKLFPPGWKWRWPIIILLIAAFALVLFGISYGIYLAVRPRDEYSGNVTIPPEYIYDFRIISRDDWFARPPTTDLKLLALPSTTVIIIHTTGNTCDDMQICSKTVKSIQADQMNGTFHFDDIAYNFLVGGDGFGYVGRGWDYQGAHSKGHNIKSIGIAFMGNFIDEAPPAQQTNAAIKLIEEGVKLKKIASDYKLFGHRQVTKTESPGQALYDIIQTLPHWSNSTE